MNSQKICFDQIYRSFVYSWTIEDRTQSPIFPWDFRDSLALIELPPSWIDCKSDRIQTKLTAVQSKRTSLENPTKK